MVCKPCRKSDHTACPEIARRINITSDSLLAPRLVAVQLAGGQVCDCQHGTDVKLGI